MQKYQENIWLAAAIGVTGDRFEAKPNQKYWKSGPYVKFDDFELKQ